MTATAATRAAALIGGGNRTAWSVVPPPVTRCALDGLGARGRVNAPMKRRVFIHTVGAAGAAAAGRFLPAPPWRSAGQLERIGLELYAVRHAMARDPERTLAAVRAIGYTDVELLWSLGNFGRTTAQVAAALQREGLRAPAAHVSPAVILVGWERSLETAKVLGHEYLIVPSFTADTTRTIDRSEEHTSELQSPCNLVCRLLLEKKKKNES